MTNAYQDVDVSERGHEDPDKHWIGESLGRASADEITFAGTKTSAGFSPFTAPADHSHDFRTRWSGLRSSDPANGKTVNAGATVFIDDLSHVWGVEDFLHSGSSQLIDIPQEGIWEIHHRFLVARTATTFPATTPYELIYKFNNAAVSHLIRHKNYPQGLAEMWMEVSDIALYASVSATSNLQIEFTNGDAVQVKFKTSQLTISRKSSFEGAGEL